MGPVFIHSLWRAGSTYVWSRFRALDTVRAYYEPFNEALGVATREELAPLSPELWLSNHPQLDRGYYAEYLPLVAGRGVPGFAKPFTVDHYFADDATLDAERPYLDLLMAQAQGRTPVLGCCRTLGRAAWLKRRYGGTHILIVRDPVQQWLSGRLRKTEAGHAYFETMPFHILGRAGWEPARRAARLFGIPDLAAESFFLEHERYFALFGGASFELSYAVFHALSALSLGRALPAADLVIDMDRLSAEPAYRRDAASRVAALTSLGVTFDDARMARHPLPRPAEDFARIEKGIAEIIGVVPAA